MVMNLDLLIVIFPRWEIHHKVNIVGIYGFFLGVWLFKQISLYIYLSIYLSIY